MRPLLFTAFVGMIGGCTDPSTDDSLIHVSTNPAAAELMYGIGIDQAASRFPSIANRIVAAKSPMLLISSDAKTVSKEHNVANRTVVLVNPGPEEIQLHGYTGGVGSPTGEISPIYEVLHRTDDSVAWEPQFCGWCGTGMSDFQVAPQSAAWFTASIHSPNEDCVIELNGAVVKGDGTEAIQLRSDIVAGQP